MRTFFLFICAAFLIYVYVPIKQRFEQAGRWRGGDIREDVSTSCRRKGTMEPSSTTAPHIATAPRGGCNGSLPPTRRHP